MPGAFLVNFIQFLLMALWKHSLGRHTDLQFDPRAVAAAHIETLLRGLAPDKPT